MLTHLSTDVQILLALFGPAFVIAAIAFTADHVAYVRRPRPLGEEA